MNDFVEKMANISGEILKMKESEKVIVSGFELFDYLIKKQIISHRFNCRVTDTFEDEFFTMVGNIQVYPCIHLKSTDFSVMTRLEYVDFLDKMEDEQEIKNEKYEHN